MFYCFMLSKHIWHAYWIIFILLLDNVYKLSVYILKNEGLNIEPRNTPSLRVLGSEVLLVAVKYNVRFLCRLFITNAICSSKLICTIFPCRSLSLTLLHTYDVYLKMLSVHLSQFCKRVNCAPISSKSILIR